MYLAQGLAGDHTHPRAHGGHLADRLLHSVCNSERGDGTRDHQRPALTGTHRRTAAGENLGHRVMQWPA